MVLRNLTLDEVAALLRRTAVKLRAMTPEEREVFYKAQRESFVAANVALDREET